MPDRLAGPGDGLAGAITSRPALADPVREVERQAERVDALLQRARVSLDASLARGGDDLAHTRARLLALSPASTLRRGYAIVQHADDGVVRARPRSARARR